MAISRLMIAVSSCIVGVLAVPVTGNAEDFNFVVPVQIDNLPPEVDFAGLGCQVYGGGVEIGQGGAPVTSIRLVAGAFHGDVAVSFNAYSGRDPHAATDYECNLSFSHTGPPTVFYFPEGSPRYSATYPDWRTFPRAAGAPFLDDTRVQPLPH
ncbi:MAG TPA: hypothetical protein VHQ39_04230 [Dongiaceae bacterium]|nr:hypothetical protein [Dongiaceae bacterium]